MDYGLRGKVAVVTGGGGAICGAAAMQLAAEGAPVAVWDLSREAAEAKADEIRAGGGRAVAVECDATSRDAVSSALDAVLAEFGTVDILVNGAGGSRRDCTTSDDLAFFDIEPEALQNAIALNYTSAVIPSQAVGRVFARKGAGVIVGISSVAGECPLTRAVGYSNAKAAVNSFTRWLAVHMAEEYSPTIRVNAVAPGFVLTQQNRFLLVDEQSGEMTDRGRRIIGNVPMRRYGLPEEIAAAVLWLASGAASFVTGAVVPVDGGFTASSGV